MTFKQIDQLVVNGKLFTASQGKAKNGSLYIMLRGVQGSRQEQLVIFDNQWGAFMVWLKNLDREIRVNDNDKG